MMRIRFGMMLVVMVMPLVASGTVLLDQNFDGVPAGTNLEDLGWEPTEYTVSSTSIDVGHSASGPGNEAVYMFNHTLTDPDHYYQIDAVVHSTSAAAYFWLQNAAGNNLFFNHAQKWGNAMEFQTQAPDGVTNTQRIGVASADPRIVRLEIFQDDAKFSFDPDGNGNFTGSFSLSDNPNEQFGFTDLKLMKFSPHGSSSSTFYDSIKVQVIGGAVWTPDPTIFEWKTNNLGSWGSTNNWDPSSDFPNKASDTAIFGSLITEPTSAVTHVPMTVNRIEFDNASHSYAISGLGSVNLVSTTTPEPVPPTMDVTGTHEFQLEVNLQNSAEVNITSDSLLSFNNAFNLGGNTLTKTGAGTLAINNQLTTAGGSVNILEGTVSGNGTVGGDLSNAAGTIAPGNSPGVLTVDGNLTNGSAGTIAMEIEGTGGAGEADGHDQIQVTGSSNFDGTLAVTTGGSYADPTTRSARDHFTLITSAGGSTGSFSSVAYDGTELSADFAGDNGSFRDHVGSGLFRNVNYDGSDVSLTNLFALEGDADGDADIDITDFNILASNFDDAGANSATNDWTTADFDADGDVDITDFNFLASNFADTGYGGAVNSVPEPTGILLAVLTFMALMNRSIFNNRGGANRQSQSLG